MGKFIQCESFIRFFSSEDILNITQFGYHDFSKMKGAYSFRIQKYYTWHFVISGCGKLEIGGKTYTLLEGDSFLIPPHTQMRYFPDEKEPWEYVWFAFKGQQSEKYVRQLFFGVDNPVIHCKHFLKIKQILKRTAESFQKENHGYYLAMSAFYELMELWTFEQKNVTLISSVCEIIDENYTLANFNIESLCKDVGISHSHLLRLFKKEYGKTVKRYVLEKRLEYAKQLLESGDVSVRAVAASCGFLDEIHFMKSFKKRFGMTATEYRKKLKIFLKGID